MAITTTEIVAAIAEIIAAIADIRFVFSWINVNNFSMILPENA
jgi:hypothetical protein